VIPAGHPSTQDSQVNITSRSYFKEKDNSKSAEEKTELIEVINECFELLRLNYQHLYFSAYPEVDAVNAAKRLWLENVISFNANIVRKATHELIKHSDYLPTISRVIKKCTELNGDKTLPNAHTAYSEACNAPSPKTNYSWSHPAVYYAGKASDWYFLANNIEQKAFPVFRAHYDKICERIRGGEELLPVQQLALPETSEVSLSKEENIQRMDTLRKQLEI